MIYQGADLSDEHEIHITIDGETALVAAGRQRVEFLATPRGEPIHPARPLHQQPDHSTVARAVSSAVVVPQTRRMHCNVEWPDCDHSIRIDKLPPCPYCATAGVQEKSSSKDIQRSYQRGYQAGRERYIYMQNRHDRIAEVLSDIANGKVADPAGAAREALQREQRNRRGGILKTYEDGTVARAL